MTNTRDIIIELKKVRKEKDLSYTDIMKLMETNGDYISKSTLSRVFAEHSEDTSFKYEETIRPIAKALLDIENIEEDDNMDTRAMKSLLKYKMQRIEELEKQNAQLKAELDKEKVKGHEKFAKERQLCNDRIDFLTSQIEIKDKRIDQLLDANFKNFNQLSDLIDKFMVCPYRKE